MFYLMTRIYTLEGQEALTNLPENKIETGFEKEEWRKKLGLSIEMDINVVHRYSNLVRSSCVQHITLSVSI